jgi:hypothetical protein
LAGLTDFGELEVAAVALALGGGEIGIGHGFWADEKRLSLQEARRSNRIRTSLPGFCLGAIALPCLLAMTGNYFC